MLIGVIADDFTGASDIANTLAKGIAPEGGLRTAQYSGIPVERAAPEVDAGVIALKSRTAPVADAVSDSLSALDWLRDQGCRQVVFKYCSTFDSTCEGNIGSVADALSAALGAERVVFCPAFPAAGRTVYQGHLFVNGRLLNESGMENHPLTPMTDANLRRWLGHQTRREVGLVPAAVVAQGAQALRDWLRNQAAPYVIADALSETDLLILAEALHDAPLITGASGIALGLARNFIRAGHATTQAASFTPVRGPEAILAGSCSGATRGQIDLHAKLHPTFAIDVPRVMSGEITSATLAQFYKMHIGQAPLAYSSGAPAQVRALQDRFGREAVAKRLDGLFADTAQDLVRSGYRRIVVAGGETSGAVAQAVADTLASSAMAVGPEIDPGVPVLTVKGAEPVALALKSGNFGTGDFFIKALRKMEEGA
ncbi:four-carbon acid sugar kinase family protein [Paracoccus sp. Z330]|uniref:3-oxo-tetronate kinase n=1 Tax=Paracoccus onchidii TaxID=3017813 RepID=A0ABT4ZBV2_9RHOB|nr:3-oxo-tetronate kinase [Paracoccus onchidii]MDB6176206.1 four-carbon acid sugar kinase family protein [Paracoccus onchidii]